MAVAKKAIMQSLKLILMSSGIVFIALLISLSFPSFSSSQNLPSLFSSLKSWLQPPYLYVIINVIILTIALSSRLHHHHHAPPPKSDVISVRADQFSPYDAVSVAGGHVGSFFGAVSVADVEIVEGKRSVALETVMEDEVADLTVDKEEEKLMVDETSTWSAPRQQGLNWQEEEKLLVDERSTWNVPRQQGLRGQQEEEKSMVDERSTWSVPRQQGLRGQQEEKSMVDERSC